MNKTKEDSETAAKRARLEASIMRKRFSSRSLSKTGKPNGCLDSPREKREQTPIMPFISAVSLTDNCEKTVEKVTKKADDAALDRYAVFNLSTHTILTLESGLHSSSRLAAEELLQEAAKAKVRAEVGGPSEWKKKPSKVNMRFVANSILHTEAQNKRKMRTLKKWIEVYSELAALHYKHSSVVHRFLWQNNKILY